jgi:sec-independent protein translocase protein TatB
MSFLGLGIPEMILCAVLALIFIGPERLPGVIRQVLSAYRQVRSLGNEWREQVEREIGADLRSLTEDVNVGLEAFGRSIEQQIQDVDAEIKDAQATAMGTNTGATTATAAVAPANPDLPELPPPATASADDDEERGKRPFDYRPGV